LAESAGGAEVDSRHLLRGHGAARSGQDPAPLQRLPVGLQEVGPGDAAGLSGREPVPARAAPGQL